MLTTLNTKTAIVKLAQRCRWTQQAQQYMTIVTALAIYIRICTYTALNTQSEDLPVFTLLAALPSDGSVVPHNALLILFCVLRRLKSVVNLAIELDGVGCLGKIIGAHLSIGNISPIENFNALTFMRLYSRAPRQLSKDVGKDVVEDCQKFRMQLCSDTADRRLHTSSLFTLIKMCMVLQMLNHFGLALNYVEMVLQESRNVAERENVHYLPLFCYMLRGQVYEELGDSLKSLNSYRLALNCIKFCNFNKSTAYHLKSELYASASTAYIKWEITKKQ